jgi:DNA-binding transcriptional ArsR family regulator
MAYSKKGDYGARHARLAELAKALGHPARIAILKTLAAHDECICGEIVEVLPLAQSTVSQHLKALKQAGLIEGKIEGPTSCYCINKATLNELQTLLNQFLAAAHNVKSRSACR